MTQELENAKRLVRLAGYHLVPRKDVVTLECNQFISATDLLRRGRAEGYPEHVFRMLHGALADKMHGLTVLSTGEDAGLNGKTFTVRAKLIAPGAGFSDPLEAEFMRYTRREEAA